jgi:hypothetical protein
MQAENAHAGVDFVDFPFASRSHKAEVLKVTASG